MCIFGLLNFGEPNFEYVLGIFFMTTLKKKPIFISYIILWLALGFALLEKFQISLLVIFLNITVMMVYEILYEILKLENYLLSFLSFFVLCVIIFSYSYSFILLFQGLPEPILVTDITPYRYLALLASSYFC